MTEYTAELIRARIEQVERIRAIYHKNPKYQETLSMDIAGLRLLLAQAVQRDEPDRSVL